MTSTLLPNDGVLSVSSQNDELKGFEVANYVRTICSLKIRILRNAMVRDRRSRFTLLLMGLVAIIGSSIWSYSFIKDAAEGPVAWRRSLIPVLSGIFVGWCFGPLLLGGVDDMVDPGRLVTIPIPRRSLAISLLCASAVGVFPLATLIAVVGVVVGHGRSVYRIVPVIVIALTFFVLCIVGSRLLSVGLALMRRYRRGRDLVVLIASMAAAGLWLMTQSMSVFGPEKFDMFIGWMRWTPPGSLGQAVIDLRNGNGLVALLRVAIVWLLLGVGVNLWIRGLALQLVSPASMSGTKRRATGGTGAQRKQPTGWRASFGFTMLRREFHYLLRSPQRRSAILVGVAIGPMFTLLQAMQAGRQYGVLFAPMAILFGVGASNNLLGNDAPSLWIERSCGVPLRILIRARSIGAIPFLLLPPLASIAVIAVVVGAPARLAIYIAVLMVVTCGLPLGVGAIISVLAPFPQIDSDNPFSNQRPTAGEGCLIGVLGVAGLVATLLLMVPPLIVGSMLFRAGVPVVGLYFFGTLLYSAALWLLATHLAALRVDTAGSVLLESLARRNATA
jgi:ABC-2 type transport system permease protein